MQNQTMLRLATLVDPLTPTQVTKAFAKNAGFEWGSDAAFDALIVTRWPLAMRM